MDWYSRDRREERPAEGGAEDQAPLAVPDEPVLAEIAEGVPPNSAEAMFVDALAAPAMKLMMHSSDIIRGLSHGCNVAERDLAITRREYSSKEAIYKGQLATLLGNKRDLKDRLSLIRLAICERWSSSETLANMQRLFAAWRAWALQPSGGALLMQEASEDLCLIVMVMYTWKGQVLKSREADTYSAARAEINRQHGAYTRWVLSVAEAFEASTLRSAMTAWSLEAMLLKGNRLAAESRLEDERRHDSGRSGGSKSWCRLIGGSPNWSRRPKMGLRGGRGRYFLLLVLPALRGGIRLAPPVRGANNAACLHSSAERRRRAPHSRVGLPRRPGSMPCLGAMKPRLFPRGGVGAGSLTRPTLCALQCPLDGSFMPEGVWLRAALRVGCVAGLAGLPTHGRQKTAPF